MRTRKKTLEEEGIDGIRLGPKKQGLKVECLAFADDLVLLAEDKSAAIKMLEKLYEIAVKTD